MNTGGTCMLVCRPHPRAVQCSIVLCHSSPSRCSTMRRCSNQVGSVHLVLVDYIAMSERTAPKLHEDRREKLDWMERGTAANTPPVRYCKRSRFRCLTRPLAARPWFTYLISHIALSLCGLASRRYAIPAREQITINSNTAPLFLRREPDPSASIALSTVPFAIAH